MTNDELHGNGCSSIEIDKLFCCNVYQIFWGEIADNWKVSAAVIYSLLFFLLVVQASISTRSEGFTHNMCNITISQTYLHFGNFLSCLMQLLYEDKILPYCRCIYVFSCVVLNLHWFPFCERNFPFCKAIISYGYPKEHEDYIKC